MFNDKTYSQKMDKTIEVFKKELTSLRTGRANASMLDLVKVDVYGQAMPLNQVSSITTPDARTINIQVWDINNVTLVDTAIKKSISVTTRKPRPGEQNGQHYFFTTEADFQVRLEDGEFLEHALVHGNWYGTSKALEIGRASCRERV